MPKTRPRPGTPPGAWVHASAQSATFRIVTAADHEPSDQLRSARRSRQLAPDLAVRPIPALGDEARSQTSGATSRCGESRQEANPNAERSVAGVAYPHNATRPRA